MSWTLSKKLLFCGSRRDQDEGGGARPSTERALKRSRAGRWSWAQKVGLLLLRLLLNSSATDIVLVTLLRTAVETAIAWYTSCYAMARGHCLH